MVTLIFKAQSAGEAVLEFDEVDGGGSRLVDGTGSVVSDVEFRGPTVVSVTETPGGPPGERIAVSPERFNFDVVAVGFTIRRKLRIANIGFSELTVSDVYVTPDVPEFSSFFTSGFTIPPFGFVELTVTFSPTQPGSYVSALVIESDDRDLSVSLEGRGQ